MSQSQCDRIILSDPLTVIALVVPLPHQQADSPQPAPPSNSRATVYRPDDAIPADHSVLPTVSSGYPDLGGTLVTCYSPLRRFTHPKAFAHDLHA